MSKQKHRENTNSALRHDTVYTDSEEALDLQILFNLLKEVLYLPPLDGDFGNGAS